MIKPGFQQTARTTVETVFELVKKTLESGEDVLISAFGKFIVRNKAARRGRNPQTVQDLTLEPRRVITFKLLSGDEGQSEWEGLIVWSLPWFHYSSKKQTIKP